MTSRYLNPFPQHFDSDGNPNAFYKVYFGEPNQDPIANPKVPFSDSALSIPLDATQTLNSTGAYAQDIFLDGAYSIRIETSQGSLWRETPSFEGLISSLFIDNFLVSSMIADTSLTIGDFVQTVGYTTAGDGGDNSYEIVAGSTGTNDGGSFIDLDNGNQAKGLFPGGDFIVNQWGASRLASDSFNVTAIQACIDRAQDFSNRTVHFPDPNYSINAEIVITKSRMALSGSSIFGTQISQTSTTANSFVVGPVDPENDTISGIGFKNLYIFAINDKTAGTGIQFTRCINVFMTNVSVIEHFVNLEIIGGTNQYYTNVVFASGSILTTAGTSSVSLTPYIFSGGGSLEPPQIIKFTNFQFGAGNVINQNITIKACDTVHFSNGYMSQAASNIAALAPDTNVNARILSVNFDQVYFDGKTTNGTLNGVVIVDNGVSVADEVHLINFNNCLFGQLQNGITTSELQIGTIKVTNCDFSNIGEFSIRVPSSTANLIVSDCYFEDSSTIIGSGYGGIFCSNGKNTSITDCIFDPVNAAAAYVAIELTGANDQITVTGNTYNNCASDFIRTATVNDLQTDKTQTFTPAIQTGTGRTISHSIQEGSYTKLGDVVYFKIRIEFEPTFTTNTDSLNIIGLPFDAANDGESVTMGMGRFDNLTFSGGYTTAIATITSNTQLVTIGETGSAVAVNTMTYGTNLLTGVTYFLSLSGHYFT